jgi:hypothetical protein
LGPYAILAPIGPSRMRGVYKAEDTRRDQADAVKVSAERFSERFEREKHAIPACNHPNEMYSPGCQPKDRVCISRFCGNRGA